jgi:hypothetical protein
MSRIDVRAASQVISEIVFGGDDSSRNCSADVLLLRIDAEKNFRPVEIEDVCEGAIIQLTEDEIDYLITALEKAKQLLAEGASLRRSTRIT